MCCTSSDNDIVIDYTYSICYLIVASLSTWHINSQWYYEVGNISIPIFQMRYWSLGSLLCLPEVTLLLCLPGLDSRLSGFWVWASDHTLIASTLTCRVLLCWHYFYSTKKTHQNEFCYPLFCNKLKYKLKFWKRLFWW